MKLNASYDLTEDRKLCSGTLSFDGETITASCNGTDVFSRGVGDIDEILIRTGVGCATLELVRENCEQDMSDSITVCSFSMSCVEEIGEFCKVVNHKLRTGEDTEMSTSDFRVCPKCGRHYAKGLRTCLFCVEKSYLFKRVLKISKPYIPAFLFSGFFITLASFCSALVPVFNERIVDGYLYNTSLSTEDAVHGIIITAALMGLAQLLNRFFSVISTRRANRTSGAMANELRLMVYDKIQRLSVSSLSRKTSGDLMKRVSRDTDVVRRFITEQGIYALEKLILFIVILIVLIRISPLLTVIILLPVPVVLVVLYKVWGMIGLRYRKQWRYASRENSVLHDIVRGIRVVKTFGNEEREIKKFSEMSKKLAEVETRNEHMWALVFPVLSFFMGIGEFFVLYFGGRMVANGSMEIGQLLEFNLFLVYIYQPLRWMTTLPRRLGEFTTSLVKIFEIIDEKDDQETAENPVTPSLDGDIVFKDVQFGYKAYEPVLRDINLTVKKGEMIGLVGHSGAGKSTLINLIMRLYDVDSGSISVDGIDVKEMDSTLYRERIGVVFQENFLFSGTVYDNIAYARPDATPGEIIAAAKAANAHEFIINLSDGYNTIVGEDGHNLSGGERQRVSIARAILRNPDILILDEATSALDPETESLIQEALARLIKGRTTFAIAHRLSTLRNADRLVVIEKGRIAEVGSHRELLLQNGIYAKLVMAQRQTSKLN